MQRQRVVSVPDSSKCGARPVSSLCPNLILLDNQIDEGVAQSNYFTVKLAPHFGKGMKEKINEQG